MMAQADIFGGVGVSWDDFAGQPGIGVLAGTQIHTDGNFYTRVYSTKYNFSGEDPNDSTIIIIDNIALQEIYYFKPDKWPVWIGAHLKVGYEVVDGHIVWGLGGELLTVPLLTFETPVLLNFKTLKLFGSADIIFRGKATPQSQSLFILGAVLGFE